MTLLQRLCRIRSNLSETWLHESKVWLDIPGYDACHAKREYRRGGGVTVLVRSNLNSNLVVIVS